LFTSPAESKFTFSALQVSELRARLEALKAEATTASMRADSLLAQKESLEARLADNAETVALASDSATIIRQARTEVETLRAQNQTYQEELQALRQRVQVCCSFSASRQVSFVGYMSSVLRVCVHA
jgi:predicted transcriptional regulator